ncbi:site-specific integrase [Synoicihabitans lomoniglobus]|uniref:Site-specific integrase n=1 Tax=Synoicihabitans lomoniglobus TaxID=2909285 RepID=A0AAF0CPX1_9BACT|nr:site-specific integrase [Opitutaceae bacterium LMO-M01]WED65867.1 site-specific integrase [Opitutaceae bacterium LMO-M01]
MIEFVFRPTRKIKGKRTVSRLWSGRYATEPGQSPVTIALGVSDEAVARAKLHEIIVTKQREAAGLIAPASERKAASTPLPELLTEYESDLKGRELEAGHVRDTVRRIEKVLSSCRWKRIADITPDSFVRYRSRMVGAAKTKKEAQISINAFLNWLVRMGMAPVNPLAAVTHVDIRGKAVRKSRAFMPDEFARLLRVSRGRRLPYLFLAYTGSRKNEAKQLKWAQVKFNPTPVVTLQAEDTKNSEPRLIPLHPRLAQELSEKRPKDATPAQRVFDPFPSYDTLLADFRRAGIERRDALGRVVHFHAFRKTFQTWGAAAGVGQRAAQEILGHSDPSLTANVYTDTTALQLHDEVAKIPWHGDAHIERTNTLTKDAQNPHKLAFRDTLAKLVELAQVVDLEAISELKFSDKLAARHGFEP